MKVILANPRGFCAGVNMAIEALNTTLETFGPPVYVYHEIVHNKHVVADFRSKGAIFVDSVDQVPRGATLVLSAHGVSPQVRSDAANRDIRVIDATCPLVMKVHTEAVRFARQDRTIFLIGHEGHDEVVGTMGEAPGRIQLVASAEAVEELELDGGSAVFLTQTTLSVDDANSVIERLKDRFPGIAGPANEDICYATQNRQQAVRELAGEAQVVLVLGSRNSSNSQRLAEVAEGAGGDVHLIDDVSDISRDWFAAEDTVLVTAGASAPERVVQETIDWLVTTFDAAVEQRSVRTEDIAFQLPVELRRAARAPTGESAAGGAGC